MERVTSPTRSIAASPSHVDIDPERPNLQNSCSKCQELGGGGGESDRNGDHVHRKPFCPCHCGQKTRRSDEENGNAMKLGVDINHEANNRRTGQRGLYDSRGPAGTTEQEFLHLQQAQSISNPAYGRKWEYFQGKNNFYCDGRVMTAPTIRFCLLSFGLILVTFGLFIAFDGPFLADRVTLAIPIVGSILFLLVVVNMVRTSCSDPGILPRASQQEHEYIERSYGRNSTTIRPPPRTKDIIVNGQTVKSKYCFTCKMFRPPRASHCGVCDNCVERFDHHCPFLGNCIGKRNYRSFYIFIISLSLLAVFVLSCSIAHLALLAKEKGNFLDALRDSPTSAVVVLISFFGMWTVIGLAGFHTYLIAMEQTTNEDIKGMFGRANAKNPYSRGNFCLNCCFILCGPHQPSLINPRGSANSDFLASLPKKNSSTVTTNATTAPFSYPTTAVRPHCGEPTSRSNNSQLQTSTLGSNGAQSGSQSPSSIPAGFTQVMVTGPRANGQLLSSSSSSVNKAGTFPETGEVHKNYNGTQKSHIPIDTIVQQPRGHGHGGHNGGLQFLGNGGIGPTGINSSPVSLSMVQLDFNPAPTSNGFSLASSRSQSKGESINKDGSMEDPTALETLTMINSPLHLDTIM